MKNDREELEGYYSSFEEEDIPEEHSFDDVPVGLGSGALLSRRRALKLGGIATLGGALGLMGLPGVAQARRRRAKLSAGLPGPPADYLSNGPFPDYRHVQVFTNTIKGHLTEAKFEIKKGGSWGDYLIQINEVLPTSDGMGQPTSKVFASTTIADLRVPDGASTLTARFSPPPFVLGGDWKYALVISRPGSDNCEVGGFTLLPDPYQGGNYWHSAGLNSDDPFYFSRDIDLVFSIYVRPV